MIIGDHLKRALHYSMTLLILISVTLGVLVNFYSNAAAQISFNPGEIIDDSIFTNSSAMSVTDIQNFLNSQTSCDTNGALSISYYFDSTNGQVNDSSNGTLVTTSRAIYGQRYANWYNQYPYSGYITNESVAPYVCLQNYVENPTTGQNNLQNPGASIPGGETAAQIIYNAGQQYSINPQVILTTLQKEQGLVTDNWPWIYEYKEAMGFNCPDTGGCTGFAGFYQQVNAATSQYRNYLDNPQNFNYVVGNNTIKYSPTSTCGSSTVNIVNQATAALYDYTPYQPDSNVVANTNPPGSTAGPGSAAGDGCAAYGNRNFWWYFNTWFGSSIQANLPGCVAATNTSLACVWDMSNPANNDQYLTSQIPVRDSLYTTQGYQYLGISFYGNVVENPGNIPIYRASKLSGGSFLTADINQYNSMVSSGWTGDGVDFYAAPAGSNTGWDVYELFNSSTGQYFFTDNTTEVSSMSSNGWTNNGVSFTSIDPIRQETPPPAGLMNVYRFYIPQSYSHFWTTSLNERDNMINAGYDYEGVSFSSYATTTSTPVYRLYAPALEQHLFTTDLNEKNTLVADGGWNYEGISFYETQTPGGGPVYRLYAPSIPTHLLTTYSSERAQLLATGQWNDEGIAWYQP